MDIFAKIDKLLEQQCYVVDWLPIVGPRDSDGQYWEVEEFFLTHRKDELFGIFAEIMLKSNCYFDFSIFKCESEEKIFNPPPEKLYEIITSCATEGTYLSLLIEKEDSLICMSHDDLCFTLYNPSEKVKQVVESLSVSSGLYFRESKN